MIIIAVVFGIRNSSRLLHLSLMLIDKYLIYIYIVENDY